MIQADRVMIQADRIMIQADRVMIQADREMIPRPQHQCLLARWLTPQAAEA